MWQALRFRKFFSQASKRLFRHLLCTGYKIEDLILHATYLLKAAEHMISSQRSASPNKALQPTAYSVLRPLPAAADLER